MIEEVAAAQREKLETEITGLKSSPGAMAMSRRPRTSCHSPVQNEASPGRYDAFADAAEPEPTPTETTPPKAKASKAKASKPAKKVGNPGYGDDHWSQVKAYWLECRSVKQTAEHFGLSPNSIKTRSRREGWGK